MTDLLHPSAGGGQDELPRLARLARRRGRAMAPQRFLVLLAGGEFEMRHLRQAWSEEPVDVERCAHLAAALVMVGQSPPDLVVVGESEGPLDPFEFLGALRRVDTATVVVVGLDQEHADQESAALVAGASSVVRRPFAPTELFGLLQPAPRARIMRRLSPLPIDLGRLKVDGSSPRIWLDGVEGLLPQMEFTLLRYLAEHQGEIVPRAELESAAWGNRSTRSNSLSVHIARLRRRLQAGAGTDWICSVRGFGYRLVVPSTAEKRPSAPRGLSLRSEVHAFE